MTTEKPPKPHLPENGLLFRVRGGETMRSAIFATTVFALIPMSLAGAEGLKPVTPNIAARPLGATASPAAEANPTIFFGRITSTITTSIVSNATFLTPSTIKCTLTATVVGSNGDGSDYIVDSDAVPATVSGGTATCILQLYYAWPLRYSSVGNVIIGYTVEGVDTNGKGRSFTNQYGKTIAVPASGTTTAANFTARL